MAVVACGTPLVCSYAASLPEVVGDAAILVDPSDVAQIVDAMRLVLTKPTLAAELRARGLARAAQCTWQRTAEDGGRRSAVGGQQSAVSSRRRAIDRLARGGYNDVGQSYYAKGAGQ